MTSKNKTKGDSFTYAFTRMSESYKKEFYLESVTLAESIISDRLLSFVKSRHVKVNDRTALKQLIDKAKKLNTSPAITRAGQELFDALDEWRVTRNKCVHAVAKSEPGEPTVTVGEFIGMAKRSAKDGKELARLVCNWHRDSKNSNKNC